MHGGTCSRPWKSAYSMLCPNQTPQLDHTQILSPTVSTKYTRSGETCQPNLSTNWMTHFERKTTIIVKLQTPLPSPQPTSLWCTQVRLFPPSPSASQPMSEIRYACHPILFHFQPSKLLISTRKFKRCLQTPQQATLLASTIFQPTALLQMCTSTHCRVNLKTLKYRHQLLPCASPLPPNRSNSRASPSAR